VAVAPVNHLGRDVRQAARRTGRTLSRWGRTVATRMNRPSRPPRLDPSSWWVGKRRDTGAREAFRWPRVPTVKSHGERYSVVEAGFRSAGGARVYADTWNRGVAIKSQDADDVADGKLRTRFSPGLPDGRGSRLRAPGSRPRRDPEHDPHVVVVAQGRSKKEHHYRSKADADLAADNLREAHARRGVRATVTVRPAGQTHLFAEASGQRDLFRDPARRYTRSRRPGWNVEGQPRSRKPAARRSPSGRRRRKTRR
jgi:hypothetical protein